MVDRPKALIFDVFGTLVDWRSSVARHAAPYLAGTGIDPIEFAARWRAEYQPGMERVRAGDRGYVPLQILHRENLERVIESYSLSIDEPEKDQMNLAWERLDAWPEVVGALNGLRTQVQIAPCSNGSVEMMTSLASFAGFPWHNIVGADIARDYKPKPEVYQASCRAMGFDVHEVMMVAAHNSDLAAARECGLKTGFFPRRAEHGPDQKADLTPERDWDIIAADLYDLGQQLLNH